MDNSIKELKRGEILFKEGEKINSLYVVNSGKISLFIERSGKKIDLGEAKASQFLGDGALLSQSAKHLTSAVAVGPSKVMEIQIDDIKSQVEGVTPGVKLLVKSLMEECKVLRNLSRSVHLEKDSSPCPQGSIPTVFCLLATVARNSGIPDSADSNIVRIDWTTLKIYTVRFFKETIQRVQGTLELLEKLGKAEIHKEENEDKIEEIVSVSIKDIQLLDDFAEFYQYNFYKPGRSEIIYIDSTALKAAEALVTFSKGIELDFRGAVNLDYEVLVADIKKNFKWDFKSLHLSALEKKGLFVKRQTSSQGRVLLSFDPVEFSNIVKYWQIIEELEQWNEKGFVDKNITVANNQNSSENQCPQCQGEISATHKFCPGCGFKLAA